MTATTAALAAIADGMDRTLRACETEPDGTQRILNAAFTLRAAERCGVGPDDPEWHRLMGTLRDLIDRAARWAI